MSLPSDKLFFSSKSADKPPGKGGGKNETVANPAAYALTGAWRKVLSNFDTTCTFEFEGAHYRSVEHAFQAAKIRLVDPARARAFAVESGTELGLGDGLAARKQRKMVTLDDATLARWNAMRDDVMTRAQAAKFGQCAAAREVLLATQRAQLWHVVRGPAERFAGLERVRDRLADRLALAEGSRKRSASRSASPAERVAAAASQRFM